MRTAKLIAVSIKTPSPRDRRPARFLPAPQSLAPPFRWARRRRRSRPERTGRSDGEPSARRVIRRNGRCSFRRRLRFLPRWIRPWKPMTGPSRLRVVAGGRNPIPRDSPEEFRHRSSSLPRTGEVFRAREASSSPSRSNPAEESGSRRTGESGIRPGAESLIGSIAASKRGFPSDAALWGTSFRRRPIPGGRVSSCVCSGSVISPRLFRSGFRSTVSSVHAGSCRRPLLDGARGADRT